MTAIEIVSIIAAVGVVIVNIITAWKVNNVAKSVNGAHTAAVNREQSLLKELATLKDVLAGKDKTAALLAQAVVEKQPAKD